MRYYTVHQEITNIMSAFIYGYLYWIQIFNHDIIQVSKTSYNIIFIPLKCVWLQTATIKVPNLLLSFSDLAYCILAKLEVFLHLNLRLTCIPVTIFQNNMTYIPKRHYQSALFTAAAEHHLNPTHDLDLNWTLT